jgi:hypothetical protein
MADVKKEIVFSKSMTADKRNADFAYLIKNLFPSNSKGLYPSRDFYLERPFDLLDTDNILDIIGSEETVGGTALDIKVIVERGSDIRFFNLGTDIESNTALLSMNFLCGVSGRDGVKIATSAENIYTIQHANSNSSVDGPFLEAWPDIAAFDGLYYWWIGSGEIYKQIGDADPTVAFNNLGFTPRFAAFYNDQMVIFGEEAGNVFVVFWDKSDADLFDKRILIPNSRLIAAGNVNGRLMLITSTANSANAKERRGEIIISGYDGEKFARMNSLRAGQNDVRYVSETGVGVGAEEMLFSVRDNDSSHNTTLYQNYVYRVKSDGSIQAQTLIDDAVHGDVHVVRQFYKFTLIATVGGSDPAPAIFINEDTDDDYEDYEEYTDTEYVTNFLASPYNRHKLEGVAIAFEKLFEQTDSGADPVTGEQLDLYYRVSERDDFTLLGEITVEKVKDEVNVRKDQSTEYATDDEFGLPEQIYQITKMPDGSALPEFNEIQFRFVSKRGFSVIGAWYMYSYITRNTLG